MPAAQDADSGQTVQIYITVLRYSVSAQEGPIWILTHTCSTIVHSDDATQCVPQLLPSDARTQIADALPYAVQWVDESPVKGIDNPEHGMLVTLGPIEHVGAEVNVAIVTWCGGLCAEGKTLVLHETSGTWSVTGSTGPRWVS